MQYLNTFKRLIVVTVGLCAVGTAFADGTDAGQVVTNTVTMNYTVNTVSQTATTTADFTVDRKLLLNVVTQQTEWVSAVPGQVGGVGGDASSIQFDITNDSNSSVDVVIAVIDQGLQQVDGFTPVGATAIAPANITVWEDTNGDGVHDAGENTLGNTPGVYALTGTFAEDDVRTISVSIDVPGAAADDLYQAYTLVAAVANAGVVIGNDDSGNISPSGTAANNPNAEDSEETVFADVFTGSTLGDDEGYDFLAGVPGPTGADDGDYDGQAVNASGFRTRVALGVAKHVEVLWDPITGNRYDGAGAPVAGSNPKAIPGAILLYVVGVAADSGLDAQAVLIDDNIPEAHVDPGNTTAELPANINMPASVDITVNGNTVTYTLDAAVIADTNYHVQDCAGNAIVSSAFQADPAEVDDADLGDCDDTETGYVAYVVTVDDSVTP